MNTYSGTKSNNVTSVAGLYSTNPLNLGGANNSPSYFNGPFVGAADATTTNVSGINDLAILETPMEFDFKAWNIPMRVFGDFAYNFEASERADAAQDAILNAESQYYAGSKGTGNVGGIIAQIGRRRQPISGLLTAACRAPSPPAVVTAVTAKAAKRAINRHEIDAAASVSTWRHGAPLRMIGAG
jgi:hypothetical protein